LLAKKFNLDPVHMALAFCHQRPFMGSVIFGATDKSQLNNIFKGLDIVLSDEIMLEINKLYKKFPITF
jgi:aryl-alcohol dehydrogenase-like predicted oxidoreductase